MSTQESMTDTESAVWENVVNLTGLILEAPTWEEKQQVAIVARAAFQAFQEAFRPIGQRW